MNFRDAPSLDAGAVGLVQGTAVEDLGETSGKFTKVAYNGSIGWAASQYLSATPVALQAVPDLAVDNGGAVITTPNGDWANTCPNGDCFGTPSTVNGLPRTHYVSPYTRSDGTHVGGYYRSK